MSSKTIAMVLALGYLSKTYGQRYLAHYLLPRLDKKRQLLLTITTALCTTKIIPYVFQLIGGVEYSPAQAIENYITKNRPNIHIEANLPYQMFEDWLEDHIKAGCGKTSLRISATLLSLQVLLGRLRVNDQKSALRWIKEFGGPVITGNTSVRAVFCYQGNLFLRVFTKDGPTLWALNGTAALLQDLLQEVLKQSLKNTASFRNPVSMYLNLGGRGWHFYETKSCRPFKNIYMLEEDRQFLLRRIHGTAISYPSFPGNKNAKRILLYGSTGTGKSTLSLALAGHLGLKARLLTISRDSEPAKLIDLLAASGSDSVLIFDEVTRNQMRPYTPSESDATDDEDQSQPSSTIDSEARREQIINDLKSEVSELDAQMITIPAMLHFLDKLSPKEDQPLVICICRINKPSEYSIDSTMFDVLQKMDKLTQPTAAELFKYMYLPDDEPRMWSKQLIDTLAERFADNIWENAVTPAAVQKFILTDYSEDPWGAVDKIEDWCNTKLGGQRPEAAQAAPDFEIDEYESSDDSDEEGGEPDAADSDGE